MSKIQLDKEQCTGCGACVTACPEHCISMQEDDEGFYYPVINNLACSKCRTCIHTCPLSDESLQNDISHDVWAVMASDELRKKSSSGGIFGLLAQKTLNKGGYVAGAVYEENFRRVKHIVSRNIDDIERMRGSKYLQSDTTAVINEIQDLITQGVWVLFSGTPCQCAAIKKVTGNPENLVTIDVICHGVPSKKMWQGFLDEVVPNQQIINVNMREKVGNNWNPTLKLSLKSGNDIIFDAGNGYSAAFLSDVGLRESCYTCKYATTHRVGDITIGDFWGVHALNKSELNDGKGTSVAIMNTQKGKDLLKSIRRQCLRCEPVPLRAVTAGNPVLTRPPSRPMGRNIFYTLLTDSGFDAAFQAAVKFKCIPGSKPWDAILFGVYWNNNVGGALTVYALYETLIEAGMNVAVPNYNNLTLTIPPALPFNRLYRDMPEADMDLVYQTNYMVLSSDQIWRPEWSWLGLSFDIAFLNLGGEDVKRVAVATSFGVDEIELHPLWNPIRSKVTAALKRFYRVSTREKSGVNILKRFGRNDGVWVIDPVFLCSKKAYDKVIDILPEIEPEFTIPEQHVFYYMLDSTGQNKVTPELKLLNKVCDILGIQNQRTAINAVEFLALMKNSEFVVTDSFHGTCYALIYQKPFICLFNERRGGARFDLFHDLGLSSRLLDRKQIYNPEAVEKLVNTPIDWDSVTAKLNKYRLDAYKFLTDSFHREFTARCGILDATPANERVLLVTWAHNAEKTIRRTINSVLAQTYNDFDYVIIDNESTDETADIVREYARNDSRIHLSKESTDVMGAKRDDSIKEYLNHYQADYFVSVDADAVYTPSFLEKSLGFLKDNQLDFVCCGSEVIDAETQQVIGSNTLESDLIIEGKGFSNFFPIYASFMKNVCGKMFKKKVVLASDYSALSAIGYGSDTMFVLQALTNAHKVGILSTTLHRYYDDSAAVFDDWDATRLEGIGALYEAAHDMLIRTFGIVSAQNHELILIDYMGELYDTVQVLLNCRMPIRDKLLALFEIFSNDYSQELASAERFGKSCQSEDAITQQRNELFSTVSKFLLTLEDVPDDLVERFCDMGEFVAAASDEAGDWILFHKLRVTYFIESGRLDEAKAKLSELKSMLPDDKELEYLSATIDS